MESVLRSSAALLPGIVSAALLVASARADVVTDWNVTANALVANDVGNNRHFCDVHCCPLHGRLRG
jgi:hypothetical protein